MNGDAQDGRAGRRPPRTVPVPRPEARPRPSRAGRLLRIVSGVLAGGLVALVLGLGVAWYLADGAGVPGPRPGLLVTHSVAAVVAVGAQVRADRRPGVGGALAAWAVVAVAAGLLLVQWWW